MLWVNPIRLEEPRYPSSAVFLAASYLFIGIWPARLDRPFIEYADRFRRRRCFVLSCARVFPGLALRVSRFVSLVFRAVRRQRIANGAPIRLDDLLGVVVILANYLHREAGAKSANPRLHRRWNRFGAGAFDPLSLCLVRGGMRPLCLPADSLHFLETRDLEWMRPGGGIDPVSSNFWQSPGFVRSGETTVAAV